VERRRRLVSSGPNHRGRVLTLVWTGNPPYVERVLEVNRGELCYIIGTIYMEMPLKPNVMDDIASDVSVLDLDPWSVTKLIPDS